MTDLKTFTIAGHHIDMSQSVIVKNEQATQVEPKVLKVLLVLAQRQNEVVTHQELMDEVWEGTEVVPNALQRCIAILRKELGDDAKSQNIIATHPRIGYRLLCDVKWTGRESLTIFDVNSKSSAFNRWSALGLVVIVILALSLRYFSDKKSLSATQQYSTFKQLTHTDAHESHLAVSPDASHLVFNRYAGNCSSHIWAKSTITGIEYQLTARPGRYGEISFTSDGREIVFSAINHCGETTVKSSTIEADCWSIATLDFALALTEPQVPQHRHRCEAESLALPKALSNHQYVFFQRQAGQFHLMQYDDINKQIMELYQSNSDYLYHFDYSPTTKRYAVMGRNFRGEHFVSILDDSGALESRHPVTLPSEMSLSEPLLIKYDITGEYLLTTRYGKLYSLTFDGSLTEIVTPVEELVSIAPHPNLNQLYAVVGGKDIDVSQIDIDGRESPKQIEDLNSQTLPFESLSRTKRQERNAKYQPGGEYIAFISNRNNADQIWLWNNETAVALTSNEGQGKIQNFSWAPAGESIAWVSNNQLAITNLSGSVEFIELPLPLRSVLTWGKTGELFVLIDDSAVGSMYHLDVKSKQLTELGINDVESAWILGEKLLFSNSAGEVFQRSQTPNDTQINPLVGLNGKAMLVREDHIYSTDMSDLTLKQYDRHGVLIKPIFNLKPTAWKVSDIQNNKLLLEQFVGINQEIVVFE